MAPYEDGIVGFGAFELNLRTGDLRKGGTKVSLPEQPFLVLKALLARPGDLVNREELRQQLWSGETFVDFEHGLNAAVRRLRDALGDSADSPRFVETLPRRGYRFVAPVTRSVAPAAASHLDTTNSFTVGAGNPAPSRRVLSIRRGPTFVVSAALLGAIVYLFWPAATSPRVPPGGRFMVAVLPFENLAGDADQDYIGDGMTDELIAQLGRLDPSRLGVIARTSARQFKNTPKRANEIGADLGVGFLIEGSVRQIGSRMRIAVRLIDVGTESQRWAEQYERDVKDLLTLQREVAAAITARISSTLGVAPGGGAGRRHSTVAEAYEHYLRGRYHLGRDNAAALEKGKEHFLKALALDASYALAYSGLADVYTELGSDGFLPMRDAYPPARVAALKALELDEMLGEAHNSLAWTAVNYYWDWREAEDHFQRAVELAPNYETAHRFYSFYLACMGRHDEALAFAEQARRLDPVSPRALMNVALVLYLARRYDEAIAHVEDTLELAPDFGPAHVLLARVFVAQGRPERAVDQMAHARNLLGSRPDVVTPHAYALARAGRRREAIAMLDGLRSLSEPHEPAPVRVAMVYIGLGEIDRAFQWLEAALEARDWQMSMLNVEPAFDALRSDGRFSALLDRVGLPR
jgi:TolB-like protein/DNA-binding winged helix-turn-helix (wHTH) protein/Tfp pilus assembly protein PilF